MPHTREQLGKHSWGEWVGAEEEKMKRDREAQWLARVLGVGLVHTGKFFV